MKSIWIGFSLLLLSTHITFSQNLNLNLKEGKTYYQNSTSKGTIVQKINGENIDMDMSIGGKMSFYVKKVHSDSYEMDVQFKSLFIEMKSPMSEISFSSDKKDNPSVFTRILSEFVNSSFQLMLNKNGTVEDIDMNNLFNGLLNSFPEIPRFQRIKFIDKLKESFGEEAFRGNLEMVTAIYPNKKVNINDSWSNVIKLESGMAGVINNTFTLKDVREKFAIIDGASATATADKDAYVELNGSPTRYDLKGSMKSSFKVDIHSGWILNAIINQQIDGSVDVMVNQVSKEVKTTPLSFKNKMIITSD